MRAFNGKRKSNHKKKDKNSEVSDDDVDDISVIGNSMAVSIKGVRELIRAISEGTQEFQDVMKNECSLIYECKSCQSLFRSVANFIAHKRHYCKKKYHSINHGFHNNEPETGNNGKDNIELVNRSNSNTNKRNEENLLSLENLPYIELSSLEAEPSCRLENPLPTSSAVLQDLVQNQKTASLRQELRELEQFNTSQATILADGSALVAGNNGKYKCAVCQTEFPTSRAMERHTNVYHQVRLCYPCPVCKLYFVSPWCVYRHLNKVHHKKEDQIRRLRPAVLSKAVKRELYQPPRVISETQTVTATIASKRAEEEKWIAQFETELHCKICNKSFSRRAALNVHSVMCKSRIKTPPKAAEKTDDNLRCQKCKKQFSRRAVLSSHEASCTNSVVPPLRLHVCKLCGRSYPRRRPLTLHLHNCPRAPPRSPLKHLLTPPKLSAAPKQQLSSPFQMKCDYNKMPTLLPRNGIVGPCQTITSKLEAVVQKLHDNPSNPNIISIKPQDGSLSSMSNNTLINVNSKLILSPSRAPPSFKVSIAGSSTVLPSNRNVFISVPSNGTVANIIPLLSLNSMLPNPKYSFFPDISQLSPRNLNDSGLSKSSKDFVSIGNKLFSPKLVNGTVINKSLRQINSTVDLSTSDVLKPGYKDKIEFAMAGCSHIPHSKTFIIPTKCAAADTSSGFYSPDSLYYRPNNLIEESHQTDSGALNSVSTDVVQNDDSSNMSLLADDSGVSDDGCLPESLQFSKFSPFKGFDPPTDQEILSAKRLSSLANYLESQLQIELN